MRADRKKTRLRKSLRKLRSQRRKKRKRNLKRQKVLLLLLIKSEEIWLQPKTLLSLWPSTKNSLRAESSLDSLLNPMDTSISATLNPCV